MAFSPLPYQTSLHPPNDHHHHSDTDVKKLQNIVGGYSDGTVRLFDLAEVEMVLKMQPHAVAVTAITFSSDGKYWVLDLGRIIKTVI